MGSGRVLAGSGCVLELKNDTSKIIEIHYKKKCFGLRRLQDGAKMDLKMHFVGVLESYEFIVKIGLRQDERHPKNRQFLKGSFFCVKKHVLSQPMVLS